MIDSIYSDAGKDGSVVITELSHKNILSLADIQRDFNAIKTQGVPLSQDFGRQLSDLVTAFRSPMLGIGNEGLKFAS